MNRDIANLRSAIEAITSLIAGRGLRVTQRGTDAFVEKCPKTNKPIRVNIPHLPDNASQELILAIHGFIDHECGHVLDTDYDVWREVDAWSQRLQRAGRGGGFSMWNITEDTYIERAQAKRFAGAGYNLERLHEFFVNGITLPKLMPAIAAEDHDRIFNLLLVPMCRAWAGQPTFIRFMEPFWPLVAKEVAKIGALKDRFPGIANSQESFDLAKELYEALYAPPPPPPAAKTPPPPKPPKAPPAPKEDPEPGERGEGDEPSDAGKGDEGEGEAREPKPEAKPEPKAEKTKPEPDAEGEPGAGDEPEPTKDESDDADDGDDEPAEPGEDEADGDPAGGDDDEAASPSAASGDDAEDKAGFSKDGTDDPLTKEQRRILKARYDRKYSFEEIARRLRKPEHDVVSIHDAALATIEANLKAST